MFVILWEIVLSVEQKENVIYLLRRTWCCTIKYTAVKRLCFVLLAQRAAHQLMTLRCVREKQE